MESYINKLKQKGFRVTIQRRCILDSLTFFPQSVFEISSFLKTHSTPVDVVTIYRTLSCFVEIGIAGKTKFKDDFSRYELISEANHHHHLVCDKCGAVEDIPLDDKLLIDEINKKTNFKVKSHALEFFGICTKCQQ